MGGALVWLVNSVFGILMFMILARAIVSWLVAFEIINTRNEFVRTILNMLESLTDPILRPLQRIVPRLGGVDLSAIVAWLLLGFLQTLFNRVAAPLLTASLG